jgi:antitoxin (DNA-binding transcriptional repressor) of toxin-antitoxin stability system
MGQTITATNAVRNFSELLNGIRYRGECYTILKGGTPAAIIGPAAASVQDRKLSDLKDILGSLPRLEDDGDAFARDIEQAVASQSAIRNPQSANNVILSSNPSSGRPPFVH